MAAILKQSEAVPAAYPATPSGLSAEAAALDPDHIWARIESYVAHRWTVRAVTWVVEGPGEWCFPLAPVAAVTSVELWNGTAWEAVAPDASPLGGYDLEDATYRLVASVGSGTPPAPVNEAFRRLAEYYADASERAGASDYSANIDGAISENYTRPANWMARAMQLSGAADLLRNYRRADNVAV